MSLQPTISRKIAWQALVSYIKFHKDPSEILVELMPNDISDQDKGLAWELTLGVIRYQKKLDHIAIQFINNTNPRQKPEISAALRMGLYQLTEMSRIPQFAAVDETVAIAKESTSIKEAGFVNAVLRSYLRAPDKIKYPERSKDPAGYLSTIYSFPEWMVNRWLARFGFDETEQLLRAYNERPTTSMKILTGKISMNDAANMLKSENVILNSGRYLPDYFSSNNISELLKSNLFKNGNSIIQDESQGIPVHLLNPPIGATVLDLCSAPGGKTISFADKVGPSGKVISLDSDKKRVDQIAQNIRRTGLTNIEIVAVDLLQIAPKEKFKYILLDVPCSGLGTLTHNADLKWSKTEHDIQRLAKIQKKLLDKAATFLADGGSLVYSTCTTESEEIENVVNSFIKSNSEFYLADGNAPFLQPFKVSTGLYRSWQHKHGIGSGGFALMRKK